MSDTPRKPQANSDSERDLVRKAKAGSREAFDALVRIHGRLILSLARSITGNRQDAEDVAQEVFLRFYRHLDQFDSARPLEPWLIRVALNASRSHVARTPARREEPLGESLAGNLLVHETQGRRMEAEEFKGALQKAVDRLGKREKMVFLLRYVHQIEVKTIAQSLAISEVTVRRQSMEARRKITESLRSQNIGPQH